MCHRFGPERPGPDPGSDRQHPEGPGANPEQTGGARRVDPGDALCDACHIPEKCDNCHLTIPGMGVYLYLCRREPPETPQPERPDHIMANSKLTVESKSTETDGTEIRTVRVIKNPWDVQWDVTDINWVSLYGTDEYIKVDFGSDGGVRMTPVTARKVLEELSKHLAETESVV